jgi:hypothetical protein
MTHSREVASMMNTVFYVVSLEKIILIRISKKLVDNNENLFIPVVNPDGLRWN